MRTFEEFFAPLLIMACNKTRLLRIENGLCPSCGGVVDDDEFLTCSLCREKSRIYRLKRIEQGVCIDCGKKVEAAGSRRCNSRMDSERQRKRSDYIKAKREGICIRCFERKLFLDLLNALIVLKKKRREKLSIPMKRRIILMRFGERRKAGKDSKREKMEYAHNASNAKPLRVGLCAKFAEQKRDGRWRTKKSQQQAK